MEIFGQTVTWIEFYGTVFGIAGVVLTILKNSWCFPTGLANVGLYAILFFQSKLYADALLQVVYILLLIYGWMEWEKRSAQKEFIATRISKRLWILLAFISAGLTMVIGTVFMKYTDASLPFLDSLLASMSLLAQWMIAKKKIENWLVWIAVDVAYVGMYIFKHLYLTGFLYFIFIILAIAGYREWKKKLVVNEQPG